MNKAIYFITVIIAIILSILLSMINSQLVLGLIIGTMFSIFNLMTISFVMNKTINGNSSLMAISSIIKLIVLFALLFLILKISNMYGFIGFAIGNMIFIIALIINERRKV